ncbi:hypothetical protein [Planomonospora sp. ID82291]|uniref:hypothetical protein n=1 Tax=Planomonospora sp. ID82291 TaxID=2738136 RepID=UPI0018C3B60F|nr:hypothetical protein [Planomonospora sp. ID82291]MBG0816471.1 hypothetical protein [Planomonospora sp. ID82291]
MRIRRIAAAAAATLATSIMLAGPAAAQDDPIESLDPGTDYVTLELVSIYCVKNSEGDHDEAYLKMGRGKVWPRSGKYQTMGTGYTRSLEDANGIEAFRFPKYAMKSFSLWDYDTTSGDDALGTFDAFGAEYGTTQTKSLSGSEGEYTITYRVVDTGE